MSKPFTRKGVARFALPIFLMLLLPSLSSAEPDPDRDSSYVGWAGIMGGPAIGLDGEPVLIRGFVQGGFGRRIPETPFVVDGGLAVGGGAGGRTSDFRPNEDVSTGSVSISMVHIEVVPFLRGVYLVHDSVGLYLGFGAGWARVHGRLSLSGEILPQTESQEQHLHITSSRSFALQSSDLPDGITESALTLRLNAGVEFTMDDALRIFVEPLALHSYHLTGGTSLRLAFFAGVATVF